MGYIKWMFDWRILKYWSKRGSCDDANFNGKIVSWDREVSLMIIQI